MCGIKVIIILKISSTTYNPNSIIFCIILISLPPNDEWKTTGTRNPIIIFFFSNLKNSFVTHIFRSLKIFACHVYPGPSLTTTLWIYCAPLWPTAQVYFLHLLMPLCSHPVWRQRWRKRKKTLELIIAKDWMRVRVKNSKFPSNSK